MRTQKPVEENSYSNTTMKVETVRDVNVVMYVQFAVNVRACSTFLMQIKVLILVPNVISSG